MSKLIILDSGHNEYVSGKQAPDGSMREWEFNNDMQYKIKAQLEYLGFDVYLTNPNPAKKNEIGLTTRANKANKYWKSKGKPDAMFVSIHANAYGEWTSANGCETFHAKNASTKSKTFAKIVNDEIHATLKTLNPKSVNRGVKQANHVVTKNAAMPAVLVEYAFYTNREDLKILKNNRQELADATVRAICEYFGVVYKEKEEIQENTEFKPYLARCNTNELNCRKGAGTSFEIERQINKGVVITIVGEKMNGNTKWLLSKSNYWVSERYMEFIRYI